MSNQQGSPRRRTAAPVDRDDCPFAAAALVFGHRWTLLILRELFHGVERFDDLQADLGVSRSTLTDRLKHLEHHGVVTRRTYQDDGQRRRARYVLTDAGRELTTTVWALTEWSERHLTGRPAPARMVQYSTNRPVSVRLENDQGDPVPGDDITWRIGKSSSTR